MSFNSLVRTIELWQAVKTRLGTLSALNSVLGGTNRIYLVTDDFTKPEGGNDTVPWGRLVVVPSETLWSVQEMPDAPRAVSWLVRAEFNDFEAANYNVAVSLDVAMSLADSLLVGWKPVGFNHVLVALPIFRNSSPSALPKWNEQSGVWFKSAEYRTEVSPL